MCSSGYPDLLYLYSKNITHTANTLSISLSCSMNEVEANEGCVFRNLFVYIDACDESC